ncbi:MAG: hypothetical protein H6722_17965 [Sandaracinus sp.]|nr:hypothetical protein [Sandaracinus sp.]
MKRRASLLAFSLLVVACGGGEATVDTTPVDVETSAGAVVLPAEAYLPRTTFGRLDVDLVRGRQSPYFANLRELVGGIPLESDDQRAVLSELLDRLDGVTFALGDIRGRGDLTGVILRGSFTLEDVQRWMIGLDQSNRQPEPIDLDGHVGWTLADASVVPVDERTWILAPTEALRETFAAPSVPAAFSDPTYLEAASRPSLADTAATLTILGTERAQQMMTRELPLTAEEAAHVRGIGVAIAAAQGVQVEGHALTDDPAVAQAIVARAAAERDELASQAPVMMFGLAPVVRGVEVTAVEADAVVRVNLADDVVRRLFGMLGGLMALQGGGQ